MKSKLVMMAFLLLAATRSFAGEFDGGSGEFDGPSSGSYSETDIQRKIRNEMAVSCRGSLCQIVGQDSHGSGWTVQFQVGYGDNYNNGGGDSIYIGGDGRFEKNDNPYANITVTYRNYKCRSNLLVTPAVYRFVNTYLYSMVNSDGSVKRNFSPADQTVILFYTTMLNKVDSCGAGLK